MVILDDHPPKLGSQLLIPAFFLSRHPPSIIYKFLLFKRLQLLIPTLTIVKILQDFHQLML